MKKLRWVVLMMVLAGFMAFRVTQGQTTGAFSSDLFVPVVLSSSGDGGSFFTTELTFTNRGTLTANVDLSYTAATGGGSGTASTTIPRGQSVFSNGIDYLKTLGLFIPDKESRIGTLRAHFFNLSTTSDVHITARITTEVKDSGGALIGRTGLAYQAIQVSSSDACYGCWDYFRRARKSFTEVTEGGRNQLIGGSLSDPLSLGSTALTTLAICGLRQNATDRSNVAFQNAGTPTDGSITLQATVFDGDTGGAGHVLPPIVLTPGAFFQISGVLGSNGLSVTNGEIIVERTSGTAPFYAYGVINDQINSDGSFVIAQVYSTTPVYGLTLPVIVQTSTFSSDLVVTNNTGDTLTIDFDFAADAITTVDKTAHFSISVANGGQRIIPDIFAYLREHSVAGVPPAGTAIAGALFATTTSAGLNSTASNDINGVFLAARTSAAGGSAGGRFGVFYTAVPYGQASTSSAWVFGLQQNAENRTNLAIVNTGETDTGIDTFVVDIYDGSTGNLVKSFDPITLKARGWTQFGAILSSAGIEQGYAQVRRTAGNNQFITYAVINDGAGPGQRTGDGAYIGGTP